RVGRVRGEHDGVNPARDRVLDELDLLVDVGLGRGPEEPDLDAVVAAGLARPGQHRLPERRVRRLDDHVDLLAGRPTAVTAAAAARRPTGRATTDDADHQRDERDDSDQRQRELQTNLRHDPTLSLPSSTLLPGTPQPRENVYFTAATVGRRDSSVKRKRFLDFHVYTCDLR